MAGPPENISPAQLWAEITRTPRPWRPVDFPRKDAAGNVPCQVALMVLTPTEQVQCAVAAEMECEKLFANVSKELRGQGYKTAYEAMIATEFLYVGARDPMDVEKKFFPSAALIRQFLTADEVAVLVEAHNQISTELGPIDAGLTDEQKEAWLDRLAVGAFVTAPFYLLSSRELKLLLKYSAETLSKLREANSSPGTPVEDSISE